MNLLELSKKYNFKITQYRLVVPANIETEELEFLIDQGYSLTFELSPLSFIWCERFLEGKRSKKREG